MQQKDYSLLISQNNVAQEPVVLVDTEPAPQPVPRPDDRQQQEEEEQKTVCSNKKNHVIGNGDIMTLNTNMDVRSWFENLPNGEERAASTAVSDPAFVGMLVSIVCNCNSSQYSTPSSTSAFTPQGVALSNGPVRAKDLTEAYNMHSHALSEASSISSSSHSSKSTTDSKGSLDQQQETITTGDTITTNTNADFTTQTILTMADEHNTSVHSLENSCKLLNGKPFAEEIDSTAFRIHPETEKNVAQSRRGTEMEAQAPPNVHSEELGEKNSIQFETQSTYATNTGGKILVGEGETLENQNTWGFENDLSITLPANSEINKKLVAGTSNKTKIGRTTLPTLPKLQSNRRVNSKGTERKIGSNDDNSNTVQSNEVDRLVKFRALQIAPMKNISTEDTHSEEDAKKRERAHKIALSKMSASRAMSIRSEAVTENTNNIIKNFMQHVCLVFTSALGGTTANSGKQQHPPPNHKSETLTQKCNQIEVLTIDPIYLNKKNKDSLKFLHDADYIINTELKRLGKVNVDINAHQFLIGTIQYGESFRPSWFNHFIESEDNFIPTVIILLARIEQSITKSFIYFHGKNDYRSKLSKSSSDEQHIEYKDAANLVTPPSSPSPQDEGFKHTLNTIPLSENGSICTAVEKDHDNEIRCIEAHNETSPLHNSSLSQKNVVNASLLPFLHPQSEQSNSNNFTGTLGYWKQLHENNIHDDVVNNIRKLIHDVMQKTPDYWHQNAEKVFKSFALKDLLLVPICSVLLIRPPSKLGVNQSIAYMTILVSQWSHIISLCLDQLQDEMAKHETTEGFDCLEADLDGLLDDDAVAKPGNGKKKKKKKKRKKKRKATTAVVETTEEKTKDTNTSLASSKEITICSSTNETNINLNKAASISDCATSVTSASVVTHSSNKILNGKTHLDEKKQKNCDASLASATISMRHVNSKNTDSVVSGTKIKENDDTKIKENDDHSSDGWETVEPKSGRSRRINVSSGKDAHPNNVPQSPNANRKNKGKSKSRQRAKQKPKEKEIPKRTSSEALEEGITKRGTNTIKALMEERNKRPSVEAKPNTEATRQVSAKSSVADQNTAQTIPESLSGVSTAPVQTLVGPGNHNSASSSVASSLEAPHATRHKPHHYHDSCKEENDVGYHLLKVCDRLSVDMKTFMRRRASALSIRRRERGVLLAALQDTVQGIWAGQCHVEMYGSCATQLDLPSSDLDVVIRGLDESENAFLQQNAATKSYDQERSSSIDSQGQRQKTPSPPSSRSYMNYPQNFYPPLTANGNRVLRLAAEVEKQPWAVQVKAIPTASVPVIKVLADPSRLPSASTGIEWMLHQQHMAAAAVAAADMKMAGGIPSNTPNSYHGTQLPWRGADVMNGLQSLDITFEGPEHGGVGSTAFSAQVVQDVVSETGLPPDATPAVQVIMVIKELLAQRRLNEPFSGGLSSYAILLLVVAVIKERQIIREEIERVEMQQRAVASECATIKSEKAVAMEKKSSWAAIAKKSSTAIKETPELNKARAMSIDSKKTTKQGTSVQSIGEKDKNLGKDDQSDEAQDSSDHSIQGYNDVLEVLCSGEATAGKLLMHFLLFYGRHFDARTSCIDVSGTHHPEFSKIKNDPNRSWSPFMKRKAGGTYNPVTEVYTVDPIVVYDPLEGRESNNVTRSCYAWTTIAWTFDHCFNSLSGVVELGSETNNNRRGRSSISDIMTPQLKQSNSNSQKVSVPGSPKSANTVGACSGGPQGVENDVSPLLELLLCF